MSDSQPRATPHGSLFQALRMDRVRRDLVRHELRAGRVRMALCILFMPKGYELSKSKCRICGELFEHNPECPDA